jgi:hypothetical protein
LEDGNVLKVQAVDLQTAAAQLNGKERIAAVNQVYKKAA